MAKIFPELTLTTPLSEALREHPCPRRGHSRNEYTPIEYRPRARPARILRCGGGQRRTSRPGDYVSVVQQRQNHAGQLDRRRLAHPPSTHPLPTVLAGHPTYVAPEQYCYTNVLVSTAVPSSTADWASDPLSADPTQIQNRVAPVRARVDSAPPQGVVFPALSTSRRSRSFRHPASHR